MKVIKKVLNIIPYLMLLLAFFLIISLVVSLQKGETPTILGKAIFIVVSPSMEDTIMTGDVIFVDTTPDELNVGDIISFRKPGEESAIITHRIVEIEVVDGINYYTTKGDNNSESLDWETGFTDDYIVGKYLSKSTILGNIYQYIFASGFNLIFTVIIAVFVIIGGMEVSNIIKTLSMQNKQKILEEREKLVQEELEKLLKQKEKE